MNKYFKYNLYVKNLKFVVTYKVGQSKSACIQLLF